MKNSTSTCNQSSARMGLFLASLMATTGLVHAAELPITPAIDAAMIYPNGATVTLTDDVELPSGVTTLVIKNFSRTADLSSLRPSGNFTAPVTIQSINFAREQDGPLTSDEIEALEAEVEDLTVRIGALTDERVAAENQLRMAEEFSRQAPRGFTEALAKRDNALADWSLAMSAIRETTRDARGELRRLQQQREALETQIDEKEKAIDELRSELSPLTVMIDVVAEDAAQGEFELSYQTNQANWSASYDAFLTTDTDGSSELRLVQLANITQSTGDDWDNVVVSLSTTRPAQGTSVPNINALQVQAAPLSLTLDDGRIQDSMAGLAPPQPEPGFADLDNRMMLRERNVATNMAVQSRAMRPDIVAQQEQAVAENAAFQAKFVISGRLSITGDGENRRVTIAEHVVEPELLAVAVPSVQEVAFIHAQLTNNTGAPLLGGAMSVYRDGTYMGQTRFGFLAVNEVRSLGFGPDDRIDISYVTEDRQVGERGLISAQKTDTRRYVTKVTNNHDSTIRVRILDRQPFSEDEDIVVERLGSSTQPSDENVDNQRGVMAWSYMYKPGESRDIKLDYRILWPSESNLTFVNRP